MSDAGTPRSSASSATVEPVGTLTMPISATFWSFAMASSIACSLAACSACFWRRSLRFLRRPVDSRDASSTLARASSSTRSRLYSSAAFAMRL